MVSTITDRVSGVVNGTAAGGGLGIWGTSGVSGTNTVVATAVPVITGYKLNMSFYIRPVINNTGPVTLNISSGGALNLLKPNGDALAAGEFNINLDYLVKFNGTEFRIVTPSF